MPGPSQDLPIVTGTIGDHVVHLPASGGVVVALRKHEQQLPLGSEHRARFEQAPYALFSNMHDLTDQFPMPDETEFGVGYQSVRQCQQRNGDRILDTNGKRFDELSCHAPGRDHG